jgi:BirA family biotin operon repressor/biotin-[acetyl-CoA-carboxylase] ligase
MTLGHPRLHLRATGSTNDRARALAQAGAPHGALVTAGEQSAGRGRQGRTWSAPAGHALLMSVVLRGSHDLLPLRAAVAVAGTCGERAAIKWPNDVLLDGRKVAGILVEARGWAVLGIGVNVALDVSTLPPELADIAGTLGRDESELDATLTELLERLEVRLDEPKVATLDLLRERDALQGKAVRWDGGEGIGAGIDDTGALLVHLPDGTTTALSAGEVTLSGRP